MWIPIRGLTHREDKEWIAVVGNAQALQLLVINFATRNLFEVTEHIEQGREQAIGFGQATEHVGGGEQGKLVDLASDSSPIRLKPRNRQVSINMLAPWLEQKSGVKEDNPDGSL